MVELAGENFEKSVTPAAVEHAFRAAAKAKFGSVDWTRGQHWLTVGAKQSMSGAITLAGPKEAASLLYKGLKDGAVDKAMAAAA